MSAALRRSFASLEVPNYKRWFAGQLISVSGNWMQIIAETWLILTLTGSALAVGITAALQFLPMLLAGAWGGLVADRSNKHSLLIRTQAAMAIPAFALFALSVGGAIAPWMVFGLVFVRGCVLAIDSPARQSFVIEIVGNDRLVNAVGLNSVLIHSSRIIGPAIAGVAIATIGVDFCFAVNALSFVAMIVALRGMDTSKLRTPDRVPRERGAVRAGLRYVRANRQLAIPLGMMAVIGTLGFNFQVLLPLFATFTFHGGAAAYTVMAAAMGVGSVIGALIASSRGRVSEHLLVGGAIAFGATALLVAAAPTITVAVLALIPLGTATVTFAAAANSSVQLGADPSMRGRVMALYMIVFMGSTPIGGPITGWLSGAMGPRAGLVMAGLAGFVAAAGAAIAFRRRPLVEVEVASSSEDDLGTSQVFAPGAPAPAPRWPRRRSERRRGSQSPQRRSPALSRRGQ
ncbi:MFS transporter [soil metagenome]